MTPPLFRFIPGVKLYCPDCRKFVTPDVIIINDKDGHTTSFEFECRLGHSVRKITEFVPAESPGKD
jgi:hypothetical protein